MCVWGGGGGGEGFDRIAQTINYAATYGFPKDTKNDNFQQFVVPANQLYDFQPEKLHFTRLHPPAAL